MTKESLNPNSIANKMASRQRDIAVSEFFLKNRHLLGFDSPAKALLITVKEAVDNALDACEEAGILPEILVEVSYHVGNVFIVAVEDNGPGIREEQLSRIFGKLLYGSKFHKLSQSRGQQGIGISAAGMYAQLTTGKPLHVISCIEGETKATELFVSIDTTKNRPDIHKKKKVHWHRPHGTRVEVQIEGHYQKGMHSIDMYLKQNAIANPHVIFKFKDMNGALITFNRCTNDLPPSPNEIKIHPQGVELGRLIQMLSSSHAYSLSKFLQEEFSRVGFKTAQKIIKQADGGLSERSRPKRIAHAQANALYKAIKLVPVSAPHTDCLVPIGEERLYEGLKKEVEANYYFVVTRPPAVYRGNPFQIEVGIAYGQPGATHFELDDKGHMRKNRKTDHDPTLILETRQGESAHILRFANRVPLLYGQTGCAITKAVTQTNWRTYGLQQSKGAIPVAPLIILVHVASVWVPFTSEAKEAIASYPEMLKELKLALQECARKLGKHIRGETRLKQEYDKRVHIEKYLPHIGFALQEMLELSDKKREQTVTKLDDIMQKNRKF